MSGSLLPHELQHARPPCLSPSPGVCPSSCPLHQWCHPTISSSVTLFFCCPHCFLASGSFPMSWLFASGGQSIGGSASAPVLPMYIQGWFPLGLTGLISSLSKGLKSLCSWLYSLLLDHKTIILPLFFLLLKLASNLFWYLSRDKWKEVWERTNRNRPLQEKHRTSLVVQGLRIRLPMQVTQVQSLVWEKFICLGATKLVHHHKRNQNKERKHTAAPAQTTTEGPRAATKTQCSQKWMSKL